MKKDGLKVSLSKNRPFNIKDKKFHNAIQISGKKTGFTAKTVTREVSQ